MPLSRGSLAPSSVVAPRFLGSIIGNTQRARHERESDRQEAKQNAYGNAMRFLLQTGDRGVIVAESPTTETLTWLDDAIDAQYWLGVLTRVCGKEQPEMVP
jgi:hypothetical protein